MRQTFSHCILLFLCGFAMLGSPLFAKGWLDFKLNQEYSVSYPENWHRVDPTSANFNVNSTESGEGNTPANLQIRTSELTKAEAAMSWQEFVTHQVKRHIAYLDDNWIENPQVMEPDTLAVAGAKMAFHLRTDLLDGDEPGVLITDYAVKGQKLYLFRFYCPADKLDKYLSDYYVMRESFKLR